jgi:hypothetical protein
MRGAGGGSGAVAVCEALAGEPRQVAECRGWRSDGDDKRGQDGPRAGPSRESASVEWLRVVAVQDDVAWRLSLDGRRAAGGGRHTAHSAQHTAGNGRWREDGRGGLARELSKSCRRAVGYRRAIRAIADVKRRRRALPQSNIRPRCAQCAGRGALPLGSGGGRVNPVSLRDFPFSRFARSPHSQPAVINRDGQPAPATSSCWLPRSVGSACAVRGTEESPGCCCCCWRCCCCMACRCCPAAISYHDDDAVAITIAITLIPFHYMTLPYTTFSTNRGKHGTRPTISLPRSAHGLQTLHTQSRCSSSIKWAPRIDLPYASKPPGLPLHLSLHTATHSSPVTCPLCPWATEYPHATCSHPAIPAAHSRSPAPGQRLHSLHSCIAFFPISHLPGSSRPLSHYPPPCSKLATSTTVDDSANANATSLCATSLVLMSPSASVPLACPRQRLN